MKLYVNTSGEDVYSRFEYPIANKSHKCSAHDCWHGGTIEPDTEYVKIVSILVGQGVYTEKYHYNCYSYIRG